jgi:MoxR-like ATPase
MTEQNWPIFRKTNKPHDGIKHLPPPPPWRAFSKKGEKDEQTTRSSPEEIKGTNFQIPDQAVPLVNAALYLRRPLLVTGRPGTGKSSLAYAIAYQLQLEKVLKWPINTRTTLDDGLYSYDAIGRLQEARLREERKEILVEPQEIGNYIKLSPLGTSFLPNNKPRVLLIDEIDKSDIDLPNDLLNLFEDGEFEIRELARISQGDAPISVQTYNDTKTAEVKYGKVFCTQFPLVIMTSNGERDFPPAFLRRCLQLEMPKPNKEELLKIVKSIFSSEPKILTLAEEKITEFLERRNAKGENLATDQLLNLVFMFQGIKNPSEEDKRTLIDHILQPLDRVRGDYS